MNEDDIEVPLLHVEGEGRFPHRLNGCGICRGRNIGNSDPSKATHSGGDLQLSNILVQPSKIFEGQSAKLSINVTNLGVDPGSYVAELQIDGVLDQGKELVLQGGQTKEVSFNVSSPTVGLHRMEIGSAEGTFVVLAVYRPQNTTINISEFTVPTSTIHPGDTVNISAMATNVGNETSEMVLALLLDGFEVTHRIVDLAAGAEQALEFNVTAPPLIGSDAEEIHALQLANCDSYFTVVKAGYYALSVQILLPYTETVTTVDGQVIQIPNYIPDGDVVSSLDGHVYESSNYTVLLPEGDHVIVMPTADKMNSYSFKYWGDGTTDLMKTVDLTHDITLVAYYGQSSSCPSLYAWNGMQQAYVGDVSNHGWLGYIDYLQSDGTAVFMRNNPWDYVPLNNIAPNNGNFELSLQQKSDEIFYLDQAYMMVVDHPANTNVYSTMVEQYLDPSYMGVIYTTPLAKNLQTPVSAVNQACSDNNACSKSENVLPAISKMDGVFTKGVNGIDSSSWNNITWNRLTLNLGDLSKASQIKLVIRAVVNWGSPNDYSNWLNMFFAQPVPNGTQVTPPPVMEVVDASGNWVPVPQGREMPIPADGVARTFVVDLTGLFPTNNYSLRISNFWNVTYDYIGIDTSPQQNVTITKDQPNSHPLPSFLFHCHVVRELHQVWRCNSTIAQ